MLDIAKNKIANKKNNNARVLQADFTEKTPELKVDIILMSLVLLHIPDTEKILKELFNIFNDGGKLLIIDFDKNVNVNHPKIYSGFTHDEIKKRLSKAGFKSNKIKTFYSGKNIFAKQDASMFISSSTK